MTREEIEELKGLAASMGLYDDKNPCKRAVILGKAIKALEQEQKTGRWIRQKGILGEETNTYECSLCGRTIYCYEEDELEDYPYCHCGAKMEG